MIITWYGHSCFKIQSGQLTLIIDPFDASVGLKPPRGKADIILSTHAHYDHANIKSWEGESFIITGPGEFEVKDISIVGIASFHDKNEGKNRGNNTIYLIDIEGIRLCHLGDLGQDKLQSDQLEWLEDADILFVPIGGEYTIDSEEAANVVHQIEPKLVIPMHYKIAGLEIDKLDGVDAFLKEMGAGKVEAQPKLTIKKKELPEETQVFVMKPASGE